MKGLSFFAAPHLWQRMTVLEARSEFIRADPTPAAAAENPASVTKAVITTNQASWNPYPLSLG
jgi:hypothetical protein